MDSPSPYTAEYNQQQAEIESRAAQTALGNQIEINIALLRDIREIKKSYWYRIGRFLCLCP